MIFTYKLWEEFCESLHREGQHSIPACRLMTERPAAAYLVLKHDVETNVAHALRMAEIEHQWGHCGSYYVQAYLLDKPENIHMLQQMQAMGHEISYHYDVMDSTGGDISAAMAEFEKNVALFEANGFHLVTLCQHGNPVVERKGYHSNRDFFRDPAVKKAFPEMADIMVDFKAYALGGTDYLYFSDAGRRFKLIYDPITNDITPSDDKNIPFDSLDDLLSYVKAQGANAIISTHPHRWVKSKAKYAVKTAVFKVIRAVAKVMMKIPFMKKFMSRYYYLAKKI